MTIAAGFCCKEGVVLCADTQLTVPGTLKYPESKIRKVGARGRVYMVYAGERNFSHMCMDKIEALVLSAKPSDRMAEVVEDACFRLHKKYYKTRPNAQYLNLIVAIKEGDASGYGLYVVDGDAFKKVLEYECIGCGYPMAKSIAGDLYSNEMPLIELVLMAMYVLDLVKRHVDGCSGKSQIVELRHSGGRRGWEDFQVATFEESFDKLRSYVRPLILRGIGCPDLEYDGIIRNFTASLVAERKRARDAFRLGWQEWQSRQFVNDESEA